MNYLHDREMGELIPTGFDTRLTGSECPDLQDALDEEREMSAEKVHFDSLPKALEFLDREWEAAIKSMMLFGQHVKELLEQMAKAQNDKV